MENKHSPYDLVSKNVLDLCFIYDEIKGRTAILAAIEKDQRSHDNAWQRDALPPRGRRIINLPIEKLRHIACKMLQRTALEIQKLHLTDWNVCHINLLWHNQTNLSLYYIYYRFRNRYWTNLRTGEFGQRYRLIEEVCHYKRTWRSPFTVAKFRENLLVFLPHLNFILSVNTFVLTEKSLFFNNVKWLLSI